MHNLFGHSKHKCYKYNIQTIVVNYIHALLGRYSSLNHLYYGLLLLTNPWFVELPEENIIPDLPDYPAVFMSGSWSPLSAVDREDMYKLNATGVVIASWAGGVKKKKKHIIFLVLI